MGEGHCLQALTVVWLVPRDRRARKPEPFGFPFSPPLINKNHFKKFFFLNKLRKERNARERKTKKENQRWHSPRISEPQLSRASKFVWFTNSPRGAR